MIAITVSTNYDDLLQIIISHNYKFFEKWYIITRKDDEHTLKVINTYNLENIEIVFFDFKAKRACFNKGGAIRYVQEHIIKKNLCTSPILILDSDIILPSNFMHLVKDIDIQADTLYGVEKRYDYYSNEALLHNKPDTVWIESERKDVLGFFQLYKNIDTFYDSSIDCSKCDLSFSRKFGKNNTIFGLDVKHLGKNGVNWKGRTVKDFK